MTAVNRSWAKLNGEPNAKMEILNFTAPNWVNLLLKLVDAATSLRSIKKSHAFCSDLHKHVVKWCMRFSWINPNATQLFVLENVYHHQRNTIIALSTDRRLRLAKWLLISPYPHHNFESRSIRLLLYNHWITSMLSKLTPFMTNLPRNAKRGVSLLQILLNLNKINHYKLM